MHLTINPKPVRFEWKVTENGLPVEGALVYNGEYKTVSATFDSSQWVNDKVATFTVSEEGGGSSSNGNYVISNAGTYKLTVSMTMANRYTFEDTAHYAVTVQRAPVTLSWSGYENLTYSGNNYCPLASYTGFGSDGEIISTVTGAAKNAGTHTARAILNNGNYTLTNPTQQFTIDKAPLTITPNAVVVTYGETPVGAGYEGVGFVSGENKSVLGGTPKYTFKYKNARATAYPDGVEIAGLTAQNYEITYAAGELTINKKIVTLSWSGTDGLIYNGEAKNVTATLVGKVAGDDLSVIIEGGNEINAGDHTAIATLTGGDKDNYELPANATQYTIARAKVKITAADKTSEEGQPLETLTATVEGTIYNNEVTYTLVMEEGETAGAYAITVTVTKTDDYDVEVVNGTYTITPEPEPDEGEEEKPEGGEVEDV
ncbi:MAG: hypothetical protein NC489_41800 [Ruminococcus flavefaciens]|nr:hypothetical protein [Ruminococcus flavefaciens]